MNNTFSILKPDALSRGLHEYIIGDIEGFGCSIVSRALYQLSKMDAEFLYFEHQKHPNFRNLVNFMSSGRVILLKISCPFTIEEFKTRCGNANPEKASIGTIRRKYGSDYTKNAIHASDSQDSFRREYGYFSSIIDF